MAEKKKYANGKDQKILQHDIEEIDKKIENIQEWNLQKKTK